MRSRRRMLSLVVVLVMLATIGCGADDEVQPAGETNATTPDPLTQPGPTEAPPPENDAGGEQRDGGGDSPPEPDEAAGDDVREGSESEGAARQRAATESESAYRAYIAAINDGDGAALCDLLPANALEVLKPPEQTASCADSLDGSIGYRDPRGYPVWKATTITGIESSVVSRELDSSRLSVAIVTEFADRSEPSVESDIAYLERSGGSWRLAKPTAALYRAIGRPELPPSVITPP